MHLTNLYWNISLSLSCNKCFVIVELCPLMIGVLLLSILYSNDYISMCRSQSGQIVKYHLMAIHMFTLIVVTKCYQYI